MGHEFYSRRVYIWLPYILSGEPTLSKADTGVSFGHGCPGAALTTDLKAVRSYITIHCSQSRSPLYRRLPQNEAAPADTPDFGKRYLRWRSASGLKYFPL
ncbi:hypothetical protein J6590_093725 [Homalodisca vitripennis]|nr:hypothetical protein J6590_093725 [Homalodisca vitripennis]